MVRVTPSQNLKPKGSGSQPSPLSSFSPSIPIWPSAAFIFFLPVQSECCAAAGIQPAKEGLYHADTTTPPPTPPASSLSHSSSSPCLSFPKLINAQASILQKIHFAVTAVLFVFRAAGLQVISRPSDIHWQTSVPLTLQSLQFSTVIYGARRTHPSLLPLSAFMMLDSRRGVHTCASALPCMVSMALSLWVTILLPLCGLVVGR